MVWQREAILASFASRTSRVSLTGGLITRRCAAFALATIRDALENAMKLTAMWLREEREPEVAVHDDFDLDPNDEKGPDTLIKMREVGDLSQRTLWSEMRRRNILSPEFDPEKEEQAIIDEIPSDPSEEEMDAALPGSTPGQNTA